jgi:hypothetical protein
MDKHRQASRRELLRRTKHQRPKSHMMSFIVKYKGLDHLFSEIPISSCVMSFHRIPPLETRYTKDINHLSIIFSSSKDLGSNVSWCANS